MKALRLSEIVNNIDAKCSFDGDITVFGVSTDTRTIKEGDLFIALVGEKFDGHDYISVAEENGAAALVCSREVKTSLPVIMVEDTLKALQQIAAYYRSTLNIKVVGITGSNGKTTTRNMTATVLSSKYKVYSTKKNFNNEIGLPKSVLELDDSYDIAVLEMGMNHLGEISVLTNIAKPDVAIITNIGMAHIGNLGSQENILKAKLEILEGLSKDGLLILNSDDKYLFSADTGDFEKAFIGFDKKSEEILCAENICSDGEGSKFTVDFNGEKADGFLPLPGKYNLYNLLEAVRCGIHFNIDVKTALKAAGGYVPESMRVETEVISGITIIKDYYNSSPDSARVALETLAGYNENGRKIAFLGEMLELGEYSEREHQTLGENCVKNNIYQAFFIGADFSYFKKGMPENSQCFDTEDRDAFLDTVKEYAKELKSGDVVLVKGSRGMKMEQAYEALKDSLNK